MNGRLVLLVCVAMFLSCAKKDHPQPFSRQTTVMETFLSVTIYDDVEKKTTDALVDSIFFEMNRIEGVMTDYSDSSEVGRINMSAGKDSVYISDELEWLLRRSLQLSAASQGSFDVSIGPLVKGWDFLDSDPKPPTSLQIRTMRNLVGYENIKLDGNKAKLAKRGMRIDLGGIAKGYAVDRSIEILKRNNIRRAIIDLGGNLYVLWEDTHMLGSDVAEILIRHPRNDGRFFGSFRMGSGGVSTSGDYQRYYMHNGTRYHHILDPATGYPARGVVSVTIIAKDATTADALSTLVFVLGREKGMQFITSQDSVEGVIVWEEGDSLRYAVSLGLESKFARRYD